MDIKQHISLNVTKGDHSFTFHMPVGTTWGNAVDAANEVLAQVCNMAKQSLNQIPPATDTTTPVEPTIVQGE